MFFSKIWKNWTNLVIWGPRRNKNLDQPLKWGTSPPVFGHLWAVVGWGQQRRREEATGAHAPSRAKNGVFL
jgi:hypothetical protein